MAAYANGVTEQFLGYNAVRSIRDNPDVASLTPLSRAMSLHLVGDAALADGGTLVRRPTLSLSFAINRALLGHTPAAYHVINIAIHLCAALLLFGVMRRVLDSHASHGGGRDGALAVAAIWVAHPLNTESVTYLPQRAESLAGLLALATCYAVLRSFSAARPRAWACAAVVLFAFAVTTKESVVAIPVLVLLYDLMTNGRAAARRRWSMYVGFAVGWTALGLLLAATWSDVLIDFRPGRTLPYLLAQPRVILEYVRLALWPDPLWIYATTGQFSLPAGVVTTEAALSIGVVVLAIAAAGFGLWRRSPVALLAAWFFLLLAPTSSIVATNDVIQEHRMYLPLVALVVAFVLGLRAGTSERAFRIVAATVVIALGIATHERNEDYHHESAAFHPVDRSMALGAVARHTYAQQQFEEAERRYRDILELPEESFGTGAIERRFHRQRAHNDLGATLVALGRQEQACAHFAVARTPPVLPEALHNDWICTAVRDDDRIAEARLTAMADGEAASPFLLNNLGVLAARRGELAQARAYFEAAIAVRGRFDWANINERTMREGGKAIELAVVPGYDDPWVLLRLVDDE